MQSTDVIRTELLELHRLLVEEARRDHERIHGKTSAGQLLDLLVNDEAFAWLKTLTSLIVELDEQEASVLDREWVERARSALRPDADGDAFQQRYEALVQRSPDVVVAHGAAMRALRS